MRACAGLRFCRRMLVLVSFGSLLVQRDQWDAYWGTKNVIFLIRDFDDATRAGALVESCQFVVLEVARRALGSVIDVGKRRRRVRGGFHR